MHILGFPGNIYNNWRYLLEKNAQLTPKSPLFKERGSLAIASRGEFIGANMQKKDIHIKEVYKADAVANAPAVQINFSSLFQILVQKLTDQKLLINYDSLDLIKFFDDKNYVQFKNSLRDLPSRDRDIILLLTNSLIFGLEKEHGYFCPSVKLADIEKYYQKMDNVITRLSAYATAEASAQIFTETIAQTMFLKNFYYVQVAADGEDLNRIKENIAQTFSEELAQKLFAEYFYAKDANRGTMYVKESNNMVEVLDLLSDDKKNGAGDCLGMTTVLGLVLLANDIPFETVKYFCKNTATGESERHIALKVNGKILDSTQYLKAVPIEEYEKASDFRISTSADVDHIISELLYCKYELLLNTVVSKKSARAEAYQLGLIFEGNDLFFQIEKYVQLLENPNEFKEYFQKQDRDLPSDYALAKTVVALLQEAESNYALSQNLDKLYIRSFKYIRKLINQLARLYNTPEVQQDKALWNNIKELYLKYNKMIKLLENP